MTGVSFELSDRPRLALKLADDAFAGELRMAAAAKLCELGRLSSGAAAELAGIPRTVFLKKLADYGVNAFHWTAEDLAGEMRHV